MSNSLTGYYEKTYENEKEQTGIPLISYSKYPISRYEAVIKYFNDHFKGGDILELGAGNRSVAKMLLSSKLNITSYIASDLSMNRLEGIRKNCNDSRLKITRVDAGNFDPASVPKADAVIMVALIKHLIDPMLPMKQIYEILKPGGLYISIHPTLPTTDHVSNYCGAVFLQPLQVKYD